MKGLCRELVVEDFILLSINNRKSMFVAGVGSCYDCQQIVPVAKVVRWVDRGKTAVCPHCKTDALIPGVVDAKLLRQGRARYFNVEDGHDNVG